MRPEEKDNPLLTGEVFYYYPNPNMLGKRLVYEDNGGYDLTCAVEQNTPYPTKDSYDICVVKPNLNVVYRGQK